MEVDKNKDRYSKHKKTIMFPAGRLYKQEHICTINDKS